MAAGLNSLKHIVVLMMENRSFDHMLGFARSAAWAIDGLKGNETNTDSAGGIAQVSSDANYAGDLTADPGHAGFDVLTQLYGDPATPVTQNPSMSGFVRSYEGKNLSPQDAHRIMKCFSPQTLPVLVNLAQQFCVCDRWFSSLPGPTFPNRAFMHAATSIGRVDMGIDWRNLSTTIYERLNQNKVDAMIYYHDSTMASTFNGLAGNSDYFGSFDDDFIAACSDNDLPAYSFLEPRFANSAGGDGQPAFAASDQHPDHDVKEGEALIQKVFNAIWGNTKVRNSTLLVIVYDEHGGLYDHVTPPSTVNPDSKIWAGSPDSLDPPFDFTRLGVRVPAVLISPYIAAGTIDSTVYDHSSIIATALKLLLPNVANASLTRRDAQANTFEKNLTLDIPREDKINLGPGATSEPPTAAQLAQPINEHLRAQVQQAAMLEQQRLPPAQRSGTNPDEIKTEAQASAYLKSVYGKIHPNVRGANN